MSPTVMDDTNEKNVSTVAVPNTEITVIPAVNELEKGPLPTTLEKDPHLVAFDEPFDEENPKDWPRSRKWIVTLVLSSTGFNRIMVSTIMAPALTVIRHDFHQTSIESVMSMSVYLLATAFGPLFIGPLSEIYGRAPVFHASSAFFLVWNLICGFSNGTGLLITSRLLAGLGASSIYALGGGVLGDLWRPEERGRSLGLYALIPLLAAAVGPILGGYISEYTTWRWMFWSTSAAQALLMLLGLLLYRETYAPVILRRRAERLRRTTGDASFATATERLGHGLSAPRLLARALTRPFRLLAFHPIVQLIACLNGFSYGILYLVLSTFSTLWTTKYNQPLGTSGLHYLALALGELVGAQVGGPLMDWSFRRLRARAPDGRATPEHRVPLALPAIVVAAAGTFVYGWTAEFRVFWLVVDIGAFVMMFGWQIEGQASQAYIIDAYPDHAGSASAASQFLRSLAAFAFPLFAPRMYEEMGWGWGNTMLGLLTLGLGLPALLVLLVYGERLRAKAQSSW